MVEVACEPKCTASVMGRWAPGSLACRNAVRRSLREAAESGRVPWGALKTKCARAWKVEAKLDGGAAAACGRPPVTVEEDLLRRVSPLPHPLPHPLRLTA